MDNNNNFVIVVDYIINIVVMHVDVIMEFFDDYEIVPYKINKDNLDQLLLLLLDLILVH
jgi:hypothetical protein